MKRYLFLTVTLVLFFSFAVNAFAATYYVKPDGNDNLDGRSDATAWKTIGKVNNRSFATGDDVYFKCGGTWAGVRLSIDWSGNEGNRAVIGAYYMNGSETIGVSGNKPVIDGNNVVPAAEYAGLIQVYRNDYVTIENIKVVSSTWDGVRFQGTSLTNTSFSNNAINIETGDIYKVGIKYQYISTGLIEGCDVTDAARTELGGGGWPAVLAITGSDGITVSKNVVHENYGEGIGIYTKSSNCIVEDNICYANKKVQIYVDHSRGNIIRRNICYNTTDPAFSPSLGIGISDESWAAAYSENNKIYNNLIAYCSIGIFLWTGHSDWPLTDTLVYNNTFVDCKIGLDFTSYRVSYPGSAIKNNIFWGITTGDSRLVTDAPSGIVFDYNLWSSEPTDNDAQGANDPSYAVPQLFKTSGWRLMEGGDLKGSDFAVQSGSLAINAGIPLGAEFKNIPDCDRCVWPANVMLIDQDSQGSGWEIGADIHVVNPVENPTALDPPTDLKVAAGQ